MISFVKCDVPGNFTGKVRQILSTKLQYGLPKVWVVVDDTLDKENHLEFFRVESSWKLEGDDARILQDALYVGSEKDEEGVVWHVYCLVSKMETEQNNVDDLANGADGLVINADASSTDESVES